MVHLTLSYSCHFPAHDFIRYFTIAHELAHNLVKPHNSEHEFYFSAICEQFMMELTQLLGKDS